MQLFAIPLFIFLASFVSAAGAGKGKVFMVFEYMDHDLTGLLHAESVTFTEAQIKFYMREILNGLNQCHRCHIIHRDVKGKRAGFFVGQDANQ